jgi:NADH:ubiquinone oxidoreductase subunit F (NADH-binding)/NAD-dependent dihydropyrimidine dehydrogenase PreA subunit
MLLESHPYRVLEGLAIAAWCVGASEAWLYIRWEYPLAVERVRRAIEQCVSAGLLGEDALGGKAPLRVRIFEGAGRFVCGEETALLQSMMGKAGFPQKRPPYPAETGLHGRPTLVNNVETLANVPWILRQGPEAFAAMGTSRSPGTKVFALAGKVAGGGLIEVPMGISIRRIVEDIGGGCAGGKAFKAVQIGGPSGGCIPARLGDTPVDYEALGEVGAMMGSGGLVVLDEDDCMVDIARYFLRFTHEESCGKCRSCRQGSGEMLERLDRLTTGQGQAGDLDRLEELCEEIPAGSLCGLGKTAANPVRTALRYFREEFEAHLAGRCPARVCPSLIRYRITDDCIGCTKCAQQCPVEAIGFAPFDRHEIDDALCVRCGACRSTCPAEAVVIDTGQGK